MADRNVTGEDIEALAHTLDAKRDDLSDREYETLQAVFRLAGTGYAVAAAPAEPDVDVEGFTFKLTPDKLEAGTEQVRRVGLSRQFSIGRTRPATPPGVPIPYPNVSL